METVLASLVFITTLLGRPIGALIFGLIADKVGRRAASIYSVAGLRRDHAADRAAARLRDARPDLVHPAGAVRAFDGIFLGGGYTGAMPLAIEYSKKDKRGFVGGLIIAGFPAAYVSINLITMLMFYCSRSTGRVALHGLGLAHPLHRRRGARGLLASTTSTRSRNRRSGRRRPSPGRSRPRRRPCRDC